MEDPNPVIDRLAVVEPARYTDTNLAPKSSPTNWSRAIRKTIYTLNIADYAPEICALTYPLIESYARKIDADFHVINERKFPGWPVVYEKLQIYDLGREAGNDWNIYIDSDALVSPEMFDVTEHLRKDTVCHNGRDMAGVRWKYDHYFRRDGRHMSSCNWLTIASDWCLDLWRPLDDLTLEEAMANINITICEHNSGLCKTEHLIDDYTLSRNIARFGLKVQTVTDLCGRLGWQGPGGQPISPFLYHQYTIPNEEKVRQMLAILSTPNGQIGPAGRGWGIMTQGEVAEYQKRWSRRPESRPGSDYVRQLTEPRGSVKRIAEADIPSQNASDPHDPPGSHIQGWMQGAELNWLCETGKAMESIVEIGSWKGRSTFALCSSGCPRVYAVDHFEGSSEHQQEFGFRYGWTPFQEFKRNIMERFDNIVLKRMGSTEAVKDFQDASVDMVFIDAEHQYDAVLQDITQWAPKARRVVAVHDAEYPSVKRALEEYFRRQPDEVMGHIWVYHCDAETMLLPSPQLAVERAV